MRRTGVDCAREEQTSITVNAIDKGRALNARLMNLLRVIFHLLMLRFSLCVCRFGVMFSGVRCHVLRLAHGTWYLTLPAVHQNSLTIRLGNLATVSQKSSIEFTMRRNCARS